MFRRSALSRQFVRLNHRITFAPDEAKGAAFRAYQDHVVEHARGTTRLWRNISIASLPILAVCAYFVFPKEAHHVQHMEELVKLPDDQWPVEMEYQNVRSKPFFWGSDKTLFWGPTNHIKKKD